MLTKIMPFLLFSTILKADFDETILQKPLKDSNEMNLTNVICNTRDNLFWDVCFNKLPDESLLMRSFKFTNPGGNKIVKNQGLGIGREFEFMFEDFARSDLGLLVWDSPDQVESHGHLKLMMFFPRTYLFAVDYTQDDQYDYIHVTLPTGEKVTFNGETKEIMNGVLSEEGQKQDGDGNSLEPEINYSGEGVVLYAHKLNDYPVGINSETRKNQMAYIEKKNHPVCKVPVSDLWYTDKKKGNNIFFNKKYVTDEAFDKYLLKKCKFSMFN